MYRKKNKRVNGYTIFLNMWCVFFLSTAHGFSLTLKNKGGSSVSKVFFNGKPIEIPDSNSVILTENLPKLKAKSSSSTSAFLDWYLENTPYFIRIDLQDSYMEFNPFEKREHKRSVPVKKADTSGPIEVIWKYIDAKDYAKIKDVTIEIGRKTGDKIAIITILK